MKCTIAQTQENNHNSLSKGRMYSEKAYTSSEINVVQAISVDLTRYINTTVHFYSTVLQHELLVRALEILSLAQSSASQVELIAKFISLKSHK